MHAWDRITPVEEVASTLNDLVRAGKLRHIGLSDVPAWYATRFTTFADLRGWERPATLQLEYSLVARNLEREHLPLARELGISITPWSPLGSGLLTGKFRRENGQIIGNSRVVDTRDSGNPVLERFAKREQNWQILDTLICVAKDLGHTPAEVALAWVMSRQCVASTLIGATKVDQLEKNLAAPSITLPPDAIRALDEASALEPTELDHFFEPALQAMINGGTSIARTFD